MKKESSFVIHDKTDIKIFLLFLLDGIHYPLDDESIRWMIRDCGVVGQFDFAECFSELEEHGHILKDEVDGTAYYMIAPQGRKLVSELYDTLPPSVRHAGEVSAKQLLSFSRRGAVVTATVETDADGRHSVLCDVHTEEAALMHFSLHGLSLDHATQIRDRFLANPERLYRSFFSVATGELDYLLR